MERRIMTASIGTSRRDFLQAATLCATGPIASALASASPAPQGLAFELPLVSLPIAGSSMRFPVRRIYCAGRNYPMTAATQDYPPPVGHPDYFTKHRDTIVQSSSSVRYPPLTKNFQYEIEMVVALKSGGTDIEATQALDCVFGYCAGLDMTRRDLFVDARRDHQAWEIGKSFDQAAPCAAIHRVADVGHLSAGNISMVVNGKTTQNADLSQMIWNVAAIISSLSREVGLAAGDLIFTGTPGGYTAVVAGDRLVGHIDHLTDIVIEVA
jgi:fumarylpyruvate hydrolase